MDANRVSLSGARRVHTLFSRLGPLLAQIGLFLGVAGLSAFLLFFGTGCHLILPYPQQSTPSSPCFIGTADIYRPLAGGKEFVEKYQDIIWPQDVNGDGATTDADASSILNQQLADYVSNHLAPGLPWQTRNHKVVLAGLESPTSDCAVPGPALAYGGPTGAELLKNPPPPGTATAFVSLTDKDGVSRAGSPALAVVSLHFAERAGFRKTAGDPYSYGERYVLFTDLFVKFASFQLGPDITVNDCYVQNVGTVIASSAGSIDYQITPGSGKFYFYGQGTAGGEHGVTGFCFWNQGAIQSFKMLQGPGGPYFSIGLNLGSTQLGQDMQVQLSFASPYGVLFDAHQPYLALADQLATSLQVDLAPTLDCDFDNDLTKYQWFENYERSNERFLGEGRTLSAVPFTTGGQHEITLVAYDSRGSYNSAAMHLEIEVPPIPDSTQRFPAVSYNTKSDQFLVTHLTPWPVPNQYGWSYDDVRCQLFNSDGTSSGPELYPFGNMVISALGRPEIAYDAIDDIFFVAVAAEDSPGSQSGHGRVVGRFLNGDGSNLSGEILLFNPSSWIGSTFARQLNVVWNSILNEFVVTAQRQGQVPGSIVISAQRLTQSSTSTPLDLISLNSQWDPVSPWYNHVLVHAPIATLPAGGRYLFHAPSRHPQLLDSQLQLIAEVPVPSTVACDVAFGQVEGQNRFLVVWADPTRKAKISLNSPPISWTGVWGVYIDPTTESYPTQLPDYSFPISCIAAHFVVDSIEPRVCYSPSLHGFFTVWRETPDVALSPPEEIRTHIRGDFVDYLWQCNVINDCVVRWPVNSVISDATGTCSSTPGTWCTSQENPFYPVVAALNGNNAAVIWQQSFPSLPGYVGIFDKLYVPKNTGVGQSITVNNNGQRVIFENVTSPGLTTVTRKSSGTTLSSSFEQSCTPPEYFEITTTATFTGKIDICLSYDPSACDADNLRLLHHEDGSWVDVTTSLDSTSHTICGSVTSLSEFVLAGLTLPTLTIAPIQPAPSPTTLTLQWQGKGYFLEEAQTLPNWSSSDAALSSVGNACQAVDSTFGSVRFYRLRDDSKSPSLHGHPVGYIGLTVPGGWSATSNPFQRLPGADHFNDLFKLSDDYIWTVLFKWDNPSGTWVWSIYLGTAVGWWPNLELPLGEGVAIGTAAGAPLTLHMAGPLATGKPVIHIPAGFSIVAPPWPIAQDLIGLCYPNPDWDWIFTFENSTGNYFGYCCLFGVWWPWDFSPPAGVPLSLCESFWSWRGAPVDWVGVCPVSLP